MDASILTTFFCFILLVINLLMFTQLRDLTNHVNVHMDRSDLHSSQLNTCLSILQQLESKIDLMFNNSPPVPGEIPTLFTPSIPVATPEYNWKEQLHKPGVQTVYVPEDWNSITTLTTTDCTEKVSTTVPTVFSPEGYLHTLPPRNPEAVLRAVIKAREDFEAKRPYAKNKAAQPTIELPAPARKKPGPKPGTTKGIKRGPYKKKAHIIKPSERS